MRFWRPKPSHSISEPSTRAPQSGEVKDLGTGFEGSKGLDWAEAGLAAAWIFGIFLDRVLFSDVF